MTDRYRPFRHGSYVSWTNFETQCVAEGLQNSEEPGHSENIAEKTVAETPLPRLSADGYVRHPEATKRMAEALMLYFQQAMPRFENRWFQQLLYTAALRVNWLEIAADFTRTSIDSLAKEFAGHLIETSEPGRPRKPYGLEKLLRATKNFLTNRLHPCTWRCRERKPSRYVTR